MFSHRHFIHCHKNIEKEMYNAVTDKIQIIILLSIKHLQILSFTVNVPHIQILLSVTANTGALSC